MKKLLVASTALVAFAAVNSAQAADPIKISVGGYMNQFVGYTDQDDDGSQDFVEVNINSETELYFRGSTTLDNGLTIGVNIDRYSDRDDSSGDDVFLQISSDTIGKIRVGQTKGAAYALSHTSPSVGAVGNNDGDVQDWISRPSNITADQTHTASESNDGQKIVYWTPNFAGFQAGLSYGVNRNNAGLEGPINVGGLGGQASTLKADGTISTTNNNNDTAWDAGIAYNGEFSGVSVGADVTYQRDFNAGTTGTAVEDRNAVRFGASVGFAGFTVGGSYRDTDNEGSVKDVDANGWDLGVSYATGPYAVSLTYMELTQDTGANSGLEHQNTTWVLGGSYDMGAGVTLVGSVFNAEYDNGTTYGAGETNSTADNEGFGVVTGLKVSF
jgi:outer membrane protein OmpU